MVSPVTPLSEPLEVVIASGQSLSPAINLSGYVLCGVYMPSSWTAAGLSFQAAFTNDGTYHDIYFDGSEVTKAVGASQFVAIDATPFLGVRHLKVRSGTSGTPVTQGAERTLTLSVGRPDT